MAPNPTSVFNTSQISKYLAHLSLPPQYEPFLSDPIAFPKTETALFTLTQCQITRFPYENLSLHYSQTHRISIEPQDVYDKLLGIHVGGPKGRGGYCMENSVLFYHVLLALGFQVYPTGVKIRLRENGVPAGDYIGWVHMVNLVTLPTGDRFAIDVSFGGDGPTKPLRLVSGHVTQNLGKQEVRLIYDSIPRQTQTQQKMWIYQYRNGPEKEWNSFYAFSEMEFLLADFRIMNYYTSGSDSFQTWNCLIVRFLRVGENDVPEFEPESSVVQTEEVGISGKIMLVNGEVKVNMGGKTKVIEVCSTEEERIAALKRWFNITLTEEEKLAIKGWHTELK